MAVALRIEALSFAYNGHRVLEGVNLAVEDGHVACLIGPNGGGKTTLLRIVLGLLEPTAGTIEVLGRSPRAARADVGYVPQDFVYDVRFPIRVRDVVAMGCLDLPWRRRRAETPDRVREALEAVGLPDTAGAWFSELSGGQRQRVLIARALTTRPKLLLLDEPTANVDAAAEMEILDLLEALHKDRTLLVVTHSADVAARFLEDIYCVNRWVHRHPPAEELDNMLMRHLVGTYNDGEGPKGAGP